MNALWRGEMPLGDAFWTWAVLGGLLVNVASSLLFLTLMTQDRPWIALAAGYGPSLPYNLLVLVGVWRAASRHEGDPLHADLARGGSVVLLAVLSLT